MNEPFPLPSTFQMLLGLYGYILPFMLYAVWSTLAIWDIGRRESMSRVAEMIWIAIVLLVPVLGALAYHLIGKSEIPVHLRTAVVGGGIGVYVLVLLVGVLVGGIS